MILFLRLLAVLLLSLEMYIWGNAFDSAMINTYLAKRVALNPFFDIPSWILVLLGLGFLFVMFFAICRVLNKSGSHYAPLLYMALPCLIAVILLFFKLPCAFVIGMPLVCAGTFGAWYSSEKNKSGRLLHGYSMKVSQHERLTAFLLIAFIVSGAILCFQYGYALWLSGDPVFILPVIMPFAGIFLKSSAKIREYISASFMNLLLCSVIYGILLIITDLSIVIDLSIVMAYLFLELECILFLRRVLPDIRNISILLFAFCVLITRYIMPPVCSPWIVPFAAYLLFNYIDNRKKIKNFLFFRDTNTKKEKTFFTKDEFNALSWGVGTMIALWLVGPDHTIEILYCLIVLFAGSLIRSKYLSNKKEDHIILKNFPFFIESVLLTGTILLIARSRAQDCILLSVCACSACLMQMIWHSGSFFTSSDNNQKRSHLFMASGYLGTAFLLLLLFFFQAPTSILLGLFFILTGLILIGESSFHLETTSFHSTAGWGLILIGQFISVTSADIALPKPVWSQNAWVCGMIAFTIYYLFRIFDFRNKMNKESRK